MGIIVFIIYTLVMLNGGMLSDKEKIEPGLAFTLGGLTSTILTLFVIFISI